MTRIGATATKTIIDDFRARKAGAAPVAAATGAASRAATDDGAGRRSASGCSAPGSSASSTRDGLRYVPDARVVANYGAGRRAADGVRGALREPAARLDRGGVRRSRGRPRRRVAAEPPRTSRPSGRGGARQGRRLHKPLGRERRRRRPRCSAWSRTPACSTPISRTSSSTPRLIRMREMIEAGRDRPADDVPGSRGPQRTARARISGMPSWPAAAHCSTWRRTAPRSPATVRQGRPGPRGVRLGRHARPRRPDDRRGQRGDAHAVRGRPGRDDATSRGRRRAASRAGSRPTATPAGSSRTSARRPLRAFIEQPAGYLGEKTDADTGWVYPGPERDPRPRPRRDDGRHRRGVPRPVARRGRRSTTGYVVNRILDAAYRSIRSGHWEPVVADVRRRGPGMTSAPRARRRADLADGRDRAPGAARGDPGRRDREGQPMVLPRRSPPTGWSTSSGPAIRGSPSRRCSRAMARTRASTRWSSCR